MPGGLSRVLVRGVRVKQPAKIPAKKPYQSPKLLVYGDLTEMTKATGRFGQIDGGSNPLKRRTGH
jgi:hypothetical protein